VIHHCIIKAITRNLCELLHPKLCGDVAITVAESTYVMVKFILT